MRYVSLKKSKALRLLALSVLVSSCSLKSNGQQQTVTIALPGAQFSLLEKMTEWISLAWASGTTSSNLDSDPTVLSDFDCFGVNVSGPGILPDPNVTCTDQTDAPAIIGGFVPNGNTSIDLLVPAGPGRNIQIFGVKSLVGCPNLHDMLHDGAINFSNIGHFYTIGGTQADIFADANVDIKVTYNSASPVRTFNNCKRNGDVDNSHVWNVFAGTGPGKVNSTKTVNGTSYIGGKFDYVGPTTQQGAMLSQSNGTLAASSYNPAHISGTVRCSTPDGHGGFYVGGSFSHVQSNSYNTNFAGLIHVAFDGSFDSSFVAQVNGTGESVYACAFDGTTLFLGGNFTQLSLDGTHFTPANALAAIPVSSPSITNLGGVISASSPMVLAMDIDHVRNKLYVGGTFTLVGVLSGHSNAAAFSTLSSNSYSAVSAWHPDTVGGVNAVYADGGSVNGYVYLGGPFTGPKSYLFRIGADGSIDATWISGLSSTVFSIAKDSLSNFYVAAYDSSSVPHVYRLDSAGAIAATLLTTSGTPEPINSIALSTDGSNQLYAGGKFNIAGHQNLVSVSDPAGAATVNSSFRADASIGSSIYSVGANQVGKLFVGGDFQSIGGVLRNNMAAIDLSSGQATSWTSPYGVGEVTAVKSDGNYVYATSQIAGANPPSVVKISTGNTGTGSWQYYTGSTSDFLSTLTLDQGTLYAGGLFTSLAGGTVTGLSNVARIDANSGTIDTTWKPVIGVTGPTGSQVSKIAVDGNTVYVGGHFTTINGSTTMTSLVGVQGQSGATGSMIAGWNDPHTPLASGVDSMVMIPANTYSFAPSGALLVGTGSYIRFVDGAGNVNLSWLGEPSISTYMTVTSKLVRAGDTLYIAGVANGTSGQGLLAYDLSTQLLIPTSAFNPGIQGSGMSVNSVEVFDHGAMLIGGSFQQVNTTAGAGGKMGWSLGLFDSATGVFY